MPSLMRKSLAVAALLTASAVVAPAAHAGGDGQVYVYGDTVSQCSTNLDDTVTLYRHYGYTVSGIQACRKTGDGSRYFGYFYAY